MTNLSRPSELTLCFPMPFLLVCLALFFGCTFASDGSKDLPTKQVEGDEKSSRGIELVESQANRQSPEFVKDIPHYDHLLATSRLEDNRIAVIVVFWEGSFVKPKMIANWLSGISKSVDIYSLCWDWDDPKRDNPLYDKMGVYKDGAVFTRFPDGTERVFKITQLDEMQTVLLEAIDQLKHRKLEETMRGNGENPR